MRRVTWGACSDAGAVHEAALQRRGLRHARMRRHAVREPDVAADDAALADGHAAEHGRARVNRDVVFEDWMARQALDQPSGRLVDGETLRTQRHALVERHAIADDRGLADHDAGP